MIWLEIRPCASHLLIITGSALANKESLCIVQEFVYLDRQWVVQSVPAFLQTLHFKSSHFHISQQSDTDTFNGFLILSFGLQFDAVSLLLVLNKSNLTPVTLRRKLQTICSWLESYRSVYMTRKWENCSSSQQEQQFVCLTNWSANQGRFWSPIKSPSITVHVFVQKLDVSLKLVFIP